MNRHGVVNLVGISKLHNQKDHHKCDGMANFQTNDMILINETTFTDINCCYSQPDS